MSLNIFLTADVHLGLKFAGYPKIQSELSEARFTTLKKMVDLANKEKCDIFVVAGDLFDHLRVAERDIVRAAQTLNQFQGKLVAVLPGNHDFIAQGGARLWPVFQDHKGDRVLLLGEKKVYQLKHYDLDASIYAGPCDAKHSENNSIGWIRKEQKDETVQYHIGVAHGSLEGVSPDFDQRFYPMRMDELLKSGLDIWLLGHTDRLQYPQKPGSMDRIFYPGTPEPNSFTCEHPGMAWVLTIDDEKKIIPMSLVMGTHRFVHDSYSISESGDLNRLLKKYSDDLARKTLLKLKLSGRLPRSHYQELIEFKRELERNVLYLELDDEEVREEITLDAINSEFTDGSFPHRLLTTLAGKVEDQEALQIAYELIQEVKK
jgi:DNA repair exonuclease SbcCD nuclease subunit